MSHSPFYIGQKVVCVDANPSGRNIGSQKQLVEGSVYTIRDLRIATPNQSNDRYDGYAYCLEEIVNPPVLCINGEVTEQYYRHFRFRPLKNVQIVESLLTSVPISKKTKEKV